MCCKTLFSPSRFGSVMYICDCGWSGTEPKFVLVPHSWNEVKSWSVDPKNGRKTPMEKQAESVKGNIEDPFAIECPNCGTEMNENRELVLDVGGDTYSVTKVYPGSVTTACPNGKTWEKTIRTDVIELRTPSDPRRMSAFSAMKWGSSIMWEVFRSLGLTRPEKPKMADFVLPNGLPDKGKFFAKYNLYREEWKALFNKEFTIKQLLDGKTEKVGLVAAKEQTRAIVIALFGTLDGIKMSTGYKLLSMASKLSDKRNTIAESMRQKMMARTTIKDLLAVIAKRDIGAGSQYLESFLIELFNNYGNIAIRTSVVKRMKSGSEWNPGMWMIKGIRAGVYEKSTWKHKDFMLLNPSFYCNEEYSMNRGKPVADKDGNGWLYNPETKVMDLVLSKDEDWHFTHGADWLRSDVHMGGKVPRHAYAD